MHGINTQYYWWYQRSYPTSINIVLQINYYYLVGITRWGNRCIPELIQLQNHPNVNINMSLLYEYRDKHEEHLHPTFKGGVRYVPAHLFSISFVQHAVWPPTLIKEIKWSSTMGVLQQSVRVYCQVSYCADWTHYMGKYVRAHMTHLKQIIVAEIEIQKFNKVIRL